MANSEKQNRNKEQAKMTLFKAYVKAVIYLTFQYTMAKTELLYPKNWGT